MKMHHYLAILLLVFVGYLLGVWKPSIGQSILSKAGL